MNEKVQNRYLYTEINIFINYYFLITFYMSLFPFPFPALTENSSLYQTLNHMDIVFNYFYNYASILQIATEIFGKLKADLPFAALR